MQSEVSAAPPAEPTELAEWLGKGRDVLDDIRSSLHTRYPSDGEEGAEEAEIPPLHGIGIASMAFVPTFLLVFLGLSNVLAPASAPSSTPAPASLGSTDLPSSPASVDRWSASLSEPLATRRVTDISADGAGAPASKLEGEEPKRVRSGSADSESWTRAAAFADGHAAAELSAAMRRKGYRVDIRLEDSATLPWVVWISTSPVSRPRTPK